MKKKALVICFKKPYPLRSGAEITMYQYIKILSEYYAVDILYLSDQKESSKEIKDICSQVFIFRELEVVKYIRMIKNCIVHNMPLQVGQMYRHKVAKWVKRHYNNYELIFCIHIKMAPYILKLALSGAIPKEKLVFCGTDAISLYCYNSYKISKGWKKAAYFFEYKKMMSYEKKVYEAIDNTILISARDKQFILEKVGAKCKPHIIYNYAIDLGYKEDVEKEPCSICFMGKMNYNPNIEAVLYFVNHIYPELKALYSNLVFHIIGGYAGKEIENLNKVDGIKVHGFVENAAEYLQKCTLVIAPMRSGAGVQNKIIQAMYLGCTVVTSEVGANGLVELQGDEIIVYHNDSEFINLLSAFLSEKYEKQRNDIGKNARAYIERWYSYDAVKRKTVEALLGENKNG